jgi:hypothetical protein
MQRTITVSADLGTYVAVGGEEVVVLALVRDQFPSGNGEYAYIGTFIGLAQALRGDLNYKRQNSIS